LYWNQRLFPFVKLTHKYTVKELMWQRCSHKVIQSFSPLIGSFSILTIGLYDIYRRLKSITLIFARVATLSSENIKNMYSAVSHKHGQFWFKYDKYKYKHLQIYFCICLFAYFFLFPFASLFLFASLRLNK